MAHTLSHHAVIVGDQNRDHLHHSTLLIDSCAKNLVERGSYWPESTGQHMI
jgi:hypothetical protein